MKNLVYLNGDLVRAEDARVPLFDRGYLYGEGLFETMRSYGGRVFALGRHLSRLLSSASDLGLELGVGEGDLAKAVIATLAANELGDAYVRLTVSQQCDAPGVESRAAGRFSVSVIALPLAPPARPDGGNVVLLEPGTAPPRHVAAHKSLSFLAYVQARRAARSRAMDEALLLNAAGEITEASTANVFFVIYGRLVTPALECGLLAGITRGIVLDLAREAGIDTAERAVTPAELGACRECFLTNSIVGLLPVTGLDGAEVHDGALGPVFRLLAAAYARAVEKDLSGG